MLDGTQAWVGYSQKQRNIAWRDVQSLGCAIPRMCYPWDVLALGWLWRRQSRDRRTFPLVALVAPHLARLPRMDVDTIIPSWKMIVCQSRRNGDASGRFERIHPHWSLMGQWSLYKYLPIVSTKLYVYDCGKWPEPDRNVQETKDKVSLIMIHHVWINDILIIDL